MAKTTNNYFNLIDGAEIASHTSINSRLSEADTALKGLETNKSSIAHTHTKAQIGLGNVDNTSDINKPLSTAMTTALSSKANTADTVREVGIKDATFLNDANIRYSYVATSLATTTIELGITAGRRLHIFYMYNAENANYGSQLAVEYVTGMIYSRSHDGANWGAWKAVALDGGVVNSLELRNNLHLATYGGAIKGWSRSYLRNDIGENYYNGFMIRNHMLEGSDPNWSTKTVDILLTREEDSRRFLRINSDAFGWSSKMIYGEHNITCSQTAPTSFIGEGCMHMTY